MTIDEYNLKILKEIFGGALPKDAREIRMVQIFDKELEMQRQKVHAFENLNTRVGYEGYDGW